MQRISFSSCKLQSIRCRELICSSRSRERDQFIPKQGSIWGKHRCRIKIETQSSAVEEEAGQKLAFNFLKDRCEATSRRLFHVKWVKECKKLSVSTSADAGINTKAEFYQNRAEKDGSQFPILWNKRPIKVRDCRPSQTWRSGSTFRGAFWLQALFSAAKGRKRASNVQAAEKTNEESAKNWSIWQSKDPDSSGDSKRRYWQQNVALVNSPQLVRTSQHFRSRQRQQAIRQAHQQVWSYPRALRAPLAVPTRTKPKRFWAFPTNLTNKSTTRGKCFSWWTIAHILDVKLRNNFFQ